MQSLSISMESSSKKMHRTSKLKMYILAIFVILLAATCYRLWITRDTVSNFHTNETEISIRIIKKPHEVELLVNRLGSAPILGSLTLSDAINLAEREFALHMNETGAIQEITIDAKLSEKDHEMLENIGLYIKESSNRTLFSLNPIDSDNSPNTNFTKYALNPFFDGDIKTTDTGSWLSIHKNGLTLHGLGAKPDIKTSPSVPENSNLITVFSSTSANIDTLNQSSVLLSSPLANIIQGLSNPWKLVVATDEQENSYYSLLIEAKFELEDLAEVAKYMISLGSLSTTALTLEDETTVSEIRSAQDPTITITTEQDTHFLHTSYGLENLHLTQTPTHLFITNHDTPPTLDDSQSNSTCKSNAHTFTKLNADQQATMTPTLSSYFKELAVNSHSIYLCW